MKDTYVYYPHGGEHFLLRWWNESEQHHVVVARRLSAVEAAARALLRDGAGHMFASSFKEVLRVELVSPPDVLGRRIAAAKHKQVINDFAWNLTWEAKRLVEAGHPPPERFRLCGARDHVRCRRCVGGVVPTRSSKQLYDEFHAKWDEVFPPTSHVLKRHEPRLEPSPSQGRQVACLDSTLWCARPEFGHHQPGVVLKSLGSLDESELTHWEPALFYCQLLGGEDASRINALLAAAKEDRSRRRAAAAAAQEASRSRREAEHVSALLRLFGPR